ncbi:MAG: PEP-CTERM sorting domain-containing protein, partial [Verrucomicrobium sp.]
IQTGLTLQGGDLRPGSTRPTTQGVTFAAGDKLGTLWVDGDFAFESGSLTFQVNAASFNVSGLADPAGENYAATIAALPTTHSAELATSVNQGTDQHDKLIINGAINGTAAGSRTVNLLALEGAAFLAGDVFNLLDWANPLNHAAFSADPTFVLPDISGSNLRWDTSLFAAQGILVVTNVPEPSRAMLLITAIGLCVFRRRRAVQRL